MYARKMRGISEMSLNLSKSVMGNKELKDMSQFLDEKNKIITLEIAKDILRDYKIITLDDNEQMLYYKNGIYHPKTLSLIKKESQKRVAWIKSYEKKEVIDTIKGLTYIEREEINQNKYLIHLKNGIFDLKENKLIDFDPNIISTIQLPINYEKSANCSKTKKFIKEVVGEDQYDLIQEMFGYCLLKTYPLNRSFMLHGTGKNGKTTLLNLLIAFLGEENISTASLQEICYNQFSRKNLYGKLANIHDDLPNNKLSSTGYFKMLTGEGYIYADVKHKEGFNFKNSAKMIFSTNDLPESEDTSYAFFRRWETIDFKNTFDGKDCDPNILEKLTTEEELSGIFNWAVEGLQRLFKNEEFSSSKTKEEIKEEWILRTDPLLSFVNLCVEYDSESFISKDDFVKAVNEFCQYHNAATITAQKIGQKIPSILPKVDGKFRPRVQNKQIRAWGGIKFNKNIEKYTSLSTDIHTSILYTREEKNKENILYKLPKNPGYSYLTKKDLLNILKETKGIEGERAEKTIELWLKRGIIVEQKPNQYVFTE
jgi:putative DNA primase/helicase